MERHNSGESGSVGDDAMSIFGQSIDVRRPGKSTRRAVTQHKNLVPEIGRAVKSGVDRLHGRAAMAEKKRVTAGARSQRSELQGARESSRRKKGLVGVEAPGGARPQEISSALYVELMQELDRVKRELGELQHEVKVAREAKAKAERDAGASAAAFVTTDSASLVTGGGERRDDHDTNEVHVDAVVNLQLAGAGRSAEDATRGTRIVGLHRDTTTASSATESSDLEASWLTAVSTDKNDDDDSSEATVITTTARQVGHEASSLQVAAGAELDSAQVQLESIRVEGLRFTTAMERTQKETARVSEEISRLDEQEKKAASQVQQLNGKLLKATSRLKAVTAAGEKADETLFNLKVTLRKLEEETEAAEKEKALTELENRCVVADMESIDAEISAAEQRIRESFRELEAARASEAAATEKLKAVIERAWRASAAVTPQGSGNITVPRFEYEYLTGRAEVVQAIADKKVAAAEAWVEAWRAGEKETTMRAEAIERELEEAEPATDVEVPAVNDQSAAEQHRLRDGPDRARPSKRPVIVVAGGASRRKTTTAAAPPSSSLRAVRNPSAPSLHIKNRRRKALIPNYLKLISGKCTGRN